MRSVQTAVHGDPLRCDVLLECVSATSLPGAVLVTRPLLRVVCQVHDDVVMARVVDSEEGPTFTVYRPVIPGTIFATGRGLTRGLDKKRGARLREAGGWHSVPLSSPEAQRWVLDRDRWGTLPAWCRRCGQTRWVSLDDLRRHRGTLRA
jgi:hypothetical protein